MAGWSKDKRKKVEAAFYNFLARCFVNSRDAGRICLGRELYDAQKMAITQIFDALEADIHEVYILKSRQLGISTVIRALMLFLLGILDGLKGAIVFDTDQNKAQARFELETMLKDLPASLKFSKIESSNRAGLSLSNKSTALFMAAGVRKTKTSGVLGRSVGLSLAHCSEICSWDNASGLEAFRNSLSEINPDRLYIYESTARGFNEWFDMWKLARADSHHCKCIFIGWWAKESQKIDKDQPDFTLYGHPPNDTEISMMHEVEKLYGVRINREQLAWYRRKMDPVAVLSDLDVDTRNEESPLKMQEQPSTEAEAFQQSGSIFFGAKQLTEMTKLHVRKAIGKYMFWVGQEFFDMKIYPATSPKQVELKVWNEPEPGGYYIIGVDPSFGHSERNDRSAVQVIKCYADGIDQVAEYAWPLITTQQLAWAVASLMGWYGRDNNEVRYILELNGPGESVFNELRALRSKIEGRLQFKEYEERGLKDLFRNIRTYIWTRPDSMGAGYNFHIKTNTQIKITLLERLRDFVSNGTLHVRSIDLVDEMATIAREGDSIGSPGTMKDDRVMAMAFAVHCWEEKLRRQLISAKHTRQAEQAKKQASITDVVALYHKNQLQNLFDKKRIARNSLNRQLQYQSWRYGSRRF